MPNNIESGGIMKKLVICSDLHEGSEKNIRSGYNFAKALGLKPSLYHIDTISPQLEKQFHSSSTRSRRIKDPVWKKNIEETSLEMVNATLGRLDIDKEDIEFENFEGSINEGIEHLSEDPEMEIISVGASHHGELHRFFLNTFAEKSLFNLNRDVLITKTSVDNFKKITYLIPYESLDEENLATVANLAKCNNAKVHMDCIVPLNFVSYNLEVFPDGPYPREVLTNEMSELHKGAEDELQKAVAILKRQGIDASYTLKMILNAEPGQRLEELIRSEKSDLVVLKPQHYIFEHLSLGSVTLDIMKKTECNLYLLHV